MCRSIKTLRGADPRASEEDIRAAALQYVRKVSGYRSPSKVNAPAFDEAVEEIARASRRLLAAVEPVAAPGPSSRPAAGSRSAGDSGGAPRRRANAAP